MLRAKSFVETAAGLVVLALGSGALLGAGCAGSRASFVESDAFADASAPPPPTITDPEAGVGPIGVGCSSDLRAVVDSSGKPTECPPEQGCLKGVCVPACDAASAVKGSVGCSFVLSTPLAHPSTKPPCFAAFVVNPWAKPAKLDVSYGGQSLDVTSFGRIPDGTASVKNWQAVPATGVPAGGVAVLFLSSAPDARTSFGDNIFCPVTPAINGATAIGGFTASTGRGLSFRIKSDVPIGAYDVLPFGGARSYVPSAQLLLPTTSWGTNFIAVMPPKGVLFDNWAHIVASEDGTTVTLLSNVAIPGGGDVGAAPKNMATTYMLNAGEVIQLQVPGDMSGSTLASNKPIAYMGGNQYFVMGGAGDATHQTILPVNALGREYVGAPYETRRPDMADETVSYRIVGAADGTVLTFDPPIPAVASALALGQVVDFTHAGPFTVRSQDDVHPFYMGQFMGGAPEPNRPGVVLAPGIVDALGDEEHVNVLPPAQFLKKYVFFTDPTYGTTNLVFTRVKSANGFKDVKVDCLGVLDEWRPVGTDGKYEVATVDLVRAGKGVGSCTNGGHVAESDAPFGLTVWGIDASSSYAYPAGGYAASINDVVVPVVPK